MGSAYLGAETRNLHIESETFHIESESFLAP